MWRNCDRSVKCGWLPGGRVPAFGALAEAGGGVAVLGQLYELALAGERCWVRHQHGDVWSLPVEKWLGGKRSDDVFDGAVLQMCVGPVIDVGCGPGRLVARLAKQGICALGVDQSAIAVDLARRSGAAAMRGDIFHELPALGSWRTALLVDGNIGIGGDPRRLLKRVREVLASGGHCLVEFDTRATGIRTRQVRLESADQIGPWFRWASVGLDSADGLARECGFTMGRVCPVGDRVIASLEAA
jgi:SAM-dependent methyltransferase